MQRDKKTYLIREVLESYLAKNRHIGYRIKVAEALRLWGKICGDWAGAHSEALHVKDGILLVNTDSPALANELSLKEQELVEDLNRELGSPLIKRIVFKSGFIRKSSPEDGEKEAEKASASSKKKLTLAEIKRVDTLVETVKEGELRTLLRKLLLTAAKRKKG